MLERYYADPGYMIDYSHARFDSYPEASFHLHDRFEIYFFISGDVNYFIEKKVYCLKYGDLLIMNSSEIHRPQFSSNTPYERIVIHFDPEVAALFEAPGHDLLKCFGQRPVGERNRISLGSVQADKMLALCEKIGSATKNGGSGSDLLKLISFIELLIYINDLYSAKGHKAEHPGMPDKLVAVLDHINNNISGDLSLAMLEKLFFINRFHLSRLFREIVGSSLHEYIIYKRVSRAKLLLSGGMSVTDAAYESGFNDYSNFFRIFKRTVGISPGRYKA